MEVTGWVHILRRRWKLTLLLLLLALGASAALASKPGPYTAQSQVVLLPSQHVSQPAGGNPYLSFGDSDTLTADLVRRTVTAPDATARLAAEGYTASYTVVDDPTIVGPVLDVTVTGNSKAAVEHTLQGVTSAIGTTLAGMQAGLAPADEITSQTVFIDPDAKLSLGKKLRTVVVVLGLGVILAIALPQIVDAAVTRRRSRSAGVFTSPPPVSPPPPPSSRPVPSSPATHPSPMWRPSPAPRPAEKRETEPVPSLKYVPDPDETMVLNSVRAPNSVGEEDHEKSTETTRQPPDFDSGFR